MKGLPESLQRARAEAFRSTASRIASEPTQAPGPYRANQRPGAELPAWTPPRPRPQPGMYAQNRAFGLDNARDQFLRGRTLGDRAGGAGALAADLTGVPALVNHMRARQNRDTQSAVTEGLTGLAQASGWSVPGRSVGALSRRAPLLGRAAEALALEAPTRVPRAIQPQTRASDVRRVFRGTNDGVDPYAPSETGWLGPGRYWTGTRQRAEEYGSIISEADVSGPFVTEQQFAARMREFGGPDNPQAFERVKNEFEAQGYRGIRGATQDEYALWSAPNEAPSRLPRNIMPQMRSERDGTILPAQPRETFGRPFSRTAGTSGDLREATQSGPQLPALPAAVTALGRPRGATGMARYRYAPEGAPRGTEWQFVVEPDAASKDGLFAVQMQLRHNGQPVPVEQALGSASPEEAFTIYRALQETLAADARAYNRPGYYISGSGRLRDLHEQFAARAERLGMLPPGYRYLPRERNTSARIVRDTPALEQPLRGGTPEALQRARAANPGRFTWENDTFHLNSPQGQIRGRVWRNNIANEDALKIDSSATLPNARGQGHGVALYEQAALEAKQRGLPLVSDRVVSEDAAHVYDALRRRGYAVTRNPNARLVGGKWQSQDGEPVFRVAFDPARSGESDLLASVGAPVVAAALFGGRKRRK